MNIYIIGKYGKYDERNKAMLSTLLEIGNINYNGFIYGEKIRNKYLKMIIKGIFKILVGINNIFLLIFSDVVIILAMNQSRIFEILLAKILKKNIITDYYISNYDTQILDRKNYLEKSLFAKLFKFQDKFVIKNVKKVIFLNKVEAERYIKLTGEDIKNIDFVIVPLCKMKTNIEKEPKLPFFNKISEEITLCWWGTYIPLHGLEKIIESAEILKERNTKFKLYLFGNSEEKSEPYRKMIETKKLQDVIIIENKYSFVNEKLPKFLLEKCDIALGNFGDSEKAKTVLVNKIIDAIQLKIPVLTGESIAPDEFFDYNNDIFRTLNNSKSIANKIIEISQIKREEITKRVTKEYEIYEKNFSYISFNNKIKKIFEREEK